MNIFFFRITSNFSSLRILLSFHALRPYKPYGLLGTGEEWDREREHSPTSLFKRPLGSEDPSKVNMALNVHINHKAYLGLGEGGNWGIIKRRRVIIYLSLNCHHQNDFCIKVGSDESHFSVS